MTANELLLWLSARTEGSWRQFRGAVQALDLGESSGAPEDASVSLHHRVRLNLERLCHVEFAAAQREYRWRVVPPSFALSQHPNGVTAVYCGARTQRLLEKIAKGSPSGVAVERILFADSPDVIRLRTRDEESLTAWAQSENILLAPDAPSALLSHIPPIDASNCRPEPMPTSGKDWSAKQFLIENKVPKWRPVTLREANAADAQGLFCLTLYQRPKYFLREGRSTVTLPGAVGKYRIASEGKRRFLKYDRHRRELKVPAILRPPLLTERALILCSGFPPAIDMTSSGRPVLTYCDIPEEVAGMAAEVLRQDFA
jgi:hypothetical protein